MVKSIIIDGNNFTDIETFYCEIDRVFTKDLNYKTGHNLDAFNDLLIGGFGVYEYQEPVKITWVNYSKSKEQLGTEIKEILQIISSHKHIELEIK
jgi:RNAse (barnase) inhibitor barstar